MLAPRLERLEEATRFPPASCSSARILRSGPSGEGVTPIEMAPAPVWNLKTSTSVFCSMKPVLLMLVGPISIVAVAGVSPWSSAK